MNLKRYILPVAALLICLSGLSQPDPKTRDKIEAMKVAFITKKLDLTPAEAQVFWPLYNENLKKMEEIRSERQALKKKLAAEGASDKDIESFLASEFALRQKEIDAQKQFFQKIKTSIPIKKVALFYRAEEEWKAELIRQLGNPKSGDK